MVIINYQFEIQHWWNTRISNCNPKLENETKFFSNEQLEFLPEPGSLHRIPTVRLIV